MTEVEPQISVVVASHNRRDLLRRFLASLAAQEIDPARFEVVIADDGSSDGSPEMVEQTPLPFRTELLRLSKGGQAKALNEGIAAAHSPICLILDDDVVACPSLVAEHLAAHQQADVLAVGALIQQPPSARDWYAHAFAADWNRRYGELAHREIHWSDCFGGNFSAPRRRLLEVGGFDTGLVAAFDIELAFRLQQAGCSPVFLARAEGVHDDQKRSARMLEDQRRYGALCPSLVESEPRMRPRLLNWFHQPSLRDTALRRLLISLRLKPRLLAALGRLMPARGKPIWFGFVSRYAFWLAVRKAMTRAEWVAATRGAAILMYHAFSATNEVDRYVMPRRAFVRQMLALKALRYRVITFGALVEELRAGRPIGRRTAVVTIDDGYLDNLEVAHPVLRRFGFPATIFLVSKRLSGCNDWDSEGAVAGRPILSAEQVLELQGQGIEFGAHTRSHPSLPSLDEAQLEAEVAGSRRDLDAAIGSAVTTFAYPFGQFNRETAAAVRDAGYRGACTVENSHVLPGTEPMLIPRLEIKGDESLWQFLVKLRFGSS